ncbi:hypothetical protein pb186bvf_003752 [Paramecium bursaria]
MLSQKSQRSQIDTQSIVESAFLENYFIHQFVLKSKYLINSESEMRALLGELVKKDKMIEEKTKLYKLTQGWFFAKQDFFIQDLVNEIEIQLASSEFRNDDYIDQLKIIPPEQRRQQYGVLKTSSFDDLADGPSYKYIFQLNNQTPLIQKGTIIQVILKLRSNQKDLKALQSTLNESVNKLNIQFRSYLEQYNRQIQPILFINGDINLINQLEYPIFFISKQTILYYFLDKLKLDKSISQLSENLIINYNLQRMSQMRFQIFQWREQADKYYQSNRRLYHFKLFGLYGVILLGIFMILKKIK